MLNIDQIIGWIKIYYRRTMLSLSKVANSEGF